MLHSKINASDKLNEAIKELLKEHSETSIRSIQYVITEHEDGDFTIETSELIVMVNGEPVEETAWEYNQSLTDDLNELLFTFIDDFKEGNEFGLIELKSLSKTA